MDQKTGVSWSSVSVQFHLQPPLYSVLLLQSARSISTVPAITSSSSRASNTDTSLESTTWTQRRSCWLC